MKLTHLSALSLLCLCPLLHAAPEALWPVGRVPGEVTDKKESVMKEHVYNVSVPTLEFFAAPSSKGKKLPAVLVIPGGGYTCQAYTKEGTEIARWFNALGYHAAVVKYRIPNNREGALDDVRRAVEILRASASERGIDAARIGMIGFSAGAHLTARILADPSHGLAFALLIYPAYLSDDGIRLKPEAVPAAPTVPTFVMQCRNDRAYGKSSLAYVHHLFMANRPVSYHLYPDGGHGFGKRVHPNTEVSQWPVAAAQWLQHLH